VSGNDSRKRLFLIICQNKASDNAAVMANGGAFRVRAADTGNALSLSNKQGIAASWRQRSKDVLKITDQFWQLGWVCIYPTTALTTNLGLSGVRTKIEQNF